MAENIDDLLNYLNTGKLPPDPDAPQKQDMVTIEAQPLVQGGPESILKEDDEPKSPLADFTRKNYNYLLDDDMDSRDLALKRAKAAGSNAADSREDMKGYISQLAQRAGSQTTPQIQQTPTSKDLLDRYNQELDRMSKPVETDTTSQLIASLGPALLGLATGGTAGMNASAQTEATGQQLLKQQQDRDAKQRQVETQASGRRLAGIASLIRAENDQQKTNANAQLEGAKNSNTAYKMLGDYQKFLVENDMKDSQQAFDKFSDLQKVTSDARVKGIDETSTMENNQLNRENDLAKAKISAAAMKGRYNGPMAEERLNQAESRRISNNPVINKLVTSKTQIERDLNTLQGGMDSGKGVPTQVLREISNGMASALAGAGSSAAGDREAMEYQNLNTSLAKLKNVIDTEGVENVTDPALLSQMKEQLNRMHTSFFNSISDRAKALKRPSNFQSVNDTQDQMINQLVGNPPVATSSAPAVDKEVSDYAKKYFNGDTDKALRYLKKAGLK